VIIGYDNGASAVKIIALNGDVIEATKCIIGSDRSAGELLLEFLSENNIPAESVETVAATGVGAEKCRFDGFNGRIAYVPEIEATGLGGSWLTKLDEAIVVSIGTGTSLALARKGSFTHIGGTGVGSGTLRGISKKMFGTTNLKELFELAEQGNRLTVDITIGDLFSGTDTLPLDLTASNLAKASDDAERADWAMAIVNTILEVAGSHAALACNGYNVKNVVITGGISQTKIAKAVYDGFTKLYKLNYVIPQYSGCATAIGAARRVQNGA
jgi:type II pantothenate kinase